MPGRAAGACRSRRKPLLWQAISTSVCAAYTGRPKTLPEEITSSTDPRPKPPAFRLWPPSLFTIFAIVLASADNFADPDLWLHVITGLIILDTWHVPRHARYFTYSAGPVPWRNHDWLSEVTLAIAYGSLGIIGLKLVKLVCVAVTISALGFGLSKTVASRSAQRVILTLTAAGLAPQMQYRPQLFTFAILSVILAMLAIEVYERPVTLWPLVPLFGLWANFHGAWLVGLGTLGLAAAVLGAQEMLAGHRPTRALKIAGVTMLCALATVLNPVGINIWSYVLHSAGDPLIRKIMPDWIPLLTMLRWDWTHARLESLQVLIPLALFVGFGLSLALAPVVSDAPLAAVAAAFVGGAFYMLRNASLGVIAIASPMAHHFGIAASRASGEPANDRSALDTSPGRIMLGTAIVVLAAAGGLLSPRLRTLNPVPADAVAFMKQRGLHGNILNHFDWGAYIIWHLMPQSKIFIDGRAEEIYSDALMRQYALFFYDLPGGNAILSEYPHDFILVSPDTGAYRTASADKNWTVIYRDDVAVLFARSSSSIAAEPQRQVHWPTKQFYFP